MGSTTEQRPRARTDGLLVERVGSETVVYDTRNKQAHCLSPIAAAVFEMSNGRRSIADLTQAAESRLGKPVSDSQIEQATAQLEERDLLVGAEPGAGVSRRQLVGRGAKLGTAALTASFVTTLGVPGAADAASCGAPCANPGDCPQGCKRCVGGRCVP